MKSIFEKELMENMARELSMSSYASEDLLKSIDYINSAIEILDNFNIKKLSNRLLNMLVKIAISPKSNPRNTVLLNIPSISYVARRAGVSEEEILSLMQQTQTGSLVDKNLARAALNNILKRTDLSSEQIEGILGKKNILNEKDLREYSNPESGVHKILRFLEDPLDRGESKDKYIKPGDEFSFSRIAKDKKNRIKKKVSYTSNELIKNIKHPYNYSNKNIYKNSSIENDNSDFDGDIENLNDINSVEDLLNLDIDDQNTNELSQHLEDFEDEV